MKSIPTITAILFFLLATPSFSQEAFDPAKMDPAYTNTLVKRVDKFLVDLNIRDEAQYDRVRDMVVRQYQEINWLEENTEAKIKDLKAQTEMETVLRDAKTDAVKSKLEVELFRLHTRFIAGLQTELTPEQVDKIKDGMTYGVLERTYNGYLNLLPELTPEQRRYILGNLLTARELAMDKGSSDEKHATFGKFKGRINNYLSWLGYDMKKAEMEAKERAKVEKGKKE